MPLEHTPLDPGALPEAVRKVLSGPAPMRLMAAKGLAPLKPTELAIVLYHLAIGADVALHTAADKSVAQSCPRRCSPRRSPSRRSTRASSTTSRRASRLQACARRGHPPQPLHRRPDGPRARPQAPERELEIVAVNEQRLLRLPAIIGALYMNARGRMSTVDRLVELAVRNNVPNPGIPRWDDVVHAVTGAKRPSKGELAEVPDDDAAFAAVAEVAVGDEKPEFASLAPDDDLEVLNATEQARIEEEKKDLPIDKLSIAAKIRLATLGNAFARAVLIRDSVRMVALAAVELAGDDRQRGHQVQRQPGARRRRRPRHRQHEGVDASSTR